MFSYEKSYYESGGPFFKITPSGYQLIILEAWRRGLEVKIRSGGRYTIESESNGYSFRLTRVSSKKRNYISEICNSKALTKSHLFDRGFSKNLPRGKEFVLVNESVCDILRFADEIGYPVCVKPSRGNKGTGVVPNIKNSEELFEVLYGKVEENKKQNIVIESHVEGHDCRFFVVGNKCVSVTHRVPANVVGNGIDNVDALIKKKNKDKLSNGGFGSKPIGLSDETLLFLKEQGLNRKSVIDKGRQMFLSRKANTSLGGDTFDITESIDNLYKDLAVNIVAAIPGLRHAGVDIIVPDFNNHLVSKHAKVLEINVAAEIGMQRFRPYGKLIPGEIVSFYFPFSQTWSSRGLWYFNLQDVNTLLSSGTVAECLIPKCPDDSEFIWVESLLKGKVQGVGFRKRIASKARMLGLHGDVCNTEDGDVLLHLIGKEKLVNEVFSYIKSLSGKAFVKSQEVKHFPPRPSVVGFFIKNDIVSFKSCSWTA